MAEEQAKTKQKAQEDLAEFDAKKDGELADKNRTLRAVKAETSKQLAVVKEQQDDDTSGIEADSELVCAKLDKQTKILKSQIQSRGLAEAAKIKIEQETYIQTKKAEAERIIAENHAMSLIQEAEAEKYSAEQLRAKRKYEKMMRGLQMMRGLALNNNVCVAGDSKDNVVAQLVANQKGGAVLGINQM